MTGSVLIAEDEPNIAESLRFVLSHAGFQVDVEADGNNVLARIEEAAADVLILDVMLPNRSGLDILQALRAGPHARLPVLMLTAKGQSRDRAAAESLGATIFMTKPFSNREVVETVKALAEV